jgi:hypothetical protein
MAVLRFLVFLFCASSFLAPRAPDDLAGTWKGRIACRSVGGSLEIVLEQAGDRWSGSATLVSGPNTVKAPLRDAQVAGSTLSFATTIERADVRFSGTCGRDGIHGTVRILEGEHTLDEGTWAVTRDGSALHLASGERTSPEQRRAIATSLARLLRQSYVDAAKGEAMAVDLERRLASGELDRFDDPLVLVDEIGRFLFAIAGDKHLKVSWQHDAIPSETPGTSEQPETQRERDDLRRELRQENFGFR